jgi:hypothetical protein
VLTALAVAALLVSHRGVRIARLWLAFVVAASSSVVVQWAAGQVHFGGDAYMTLLYLGAFALALGLGSQLALDFDPVSSRLAAALHWGIAAAAVLSVGIALQQWLGPGAWGIWSTDRPLTLRPFANVSQPNHFSTLCFLGLASLAWLRQSAQVGTPASWLPALLLVTGIALSGSRTGFLQLAALFGLSALHARRVRLNPGPIECFAWLGALVVGAMVWQPANRLVFGSEVGRTVAEALTAGGTRTQHWLALSDAALREPWFGYGWSQISAAQMRVAADHPYVGEHITHSHNLVLDLVLWTGIPLGLVLTAMIFLWFTRALRAPQDAPAFWATCGAVGVLVHALLEYPHTYAYFLVPMGLMCGMAGRHSDSRLVEVPPVVAGAAVLAFGAAMVPLLLEYPRAEDAFRDLRMESAGFAPAGKAAPAEFTVLTQLDNLQRFGRVQARPQMPAGEVEWMRHVAQRYSYPGVMLRYALAAGLNGDAAAAQHVLRSLCRMHPRARCSELHDAWQGLVKTYPQLQSIALPERPDPE